ncbi:FAS-associated death domain protein isoform X3 [Choloepus didactylus]|uniref:FAS-associated death domain protein isoform X3 n=1 Tax=Choloepus didactylus TaxID=27675 RepID=UPI00189F956E|nr:FAS-associated death domain protein isoform X3 [Choloepus didactylus]
MDPFLVLLHSVSAGLANSELAELKFLCRGHLSKKKLERVQSGVDLFSMLLEQNELDSENTRLLRELLTSLRRQDLLRRLDDFEAGAAAQAAPQEEDLHAAFDIICDNVGKDWRRLARHLKVSDHKIEEAACACLGRGQTRSSRPAPAVSSVFSSPPLRQTDGASRGGRSPRPFPLHPT